MPSIAQAHFLSVSRNFDFLKSTLSPFVIFYVFQKFYNLRKYVRVQQDTITTVSKFLLCGQDYKMSWAMQMFEVPLLHRVFAWLMLISTL